MNKHRGLWYMETTPEAKKRKKRNARQRELWRQFKNKTAEEKFEIRQYRLWWKLHSIFTRKEFVTYESLPEELQNTIEPFREFIYPASNSSSI